MGLKFSISQLNPSPIFFPRKSSNMKTIQARTRETKHKRISRLSTSQTKTIEPSHTLQVNTSIIFQEKKQHNKLKLIQEGKKGVMGLNKGYTTGQRSETLHNLIEIKLT